MMHVNLVDKWSLLRSDVIVSDISDYQPITLSWKSCAISTGKPFKFNRIWLEDVDYNNMVNSVWQQEVDDMSLMEWDRFHFKL